MKRRALAAAAGRFIGGTVGSSKSPVTADQVDELLVLLHRRGINRSLQSATYGYLARGMSAAHADVQKKKLLGTFVVRS